MKVRQVGDPRLEQLFKVSDSEEHGVRPIVQLRRKGPSRWVYAAAIIIFALLLFLLLESRRTAVVEQPFSESENATFTAPQAPLYIPPAPVFLTPTVPTPAPPQIAPVYVSPTPVVQTVRAPPPNRSAPPSYPVTVAPMPMPPPARRVGTAGGPALIYDSNAQQPAGPDAPASQFRGVPGGDSVWGGRARAGTLANPSTTVAQGVLIPAVLETGFNSTQAGLARAIVSRDVRSFDGTRVLIPRGSRLIGQYRAEVTPGQKRAIISWTRLIRTDGMTIALNSPSVDPVGRGGVRARVDNHLLERVTDALLETTMSLGANLARSRSRSNVVVAMPGSTQSGFAGGNSGQIVPTLSVAPGTSISIFVAQDLEFGSGTGSR